MIPRVSGLVVLKVPRASGNAVFRASEHVPSRSLGQFMEIVPPPIPVSVDFSGTATRSGSSPHVSMRDVNCKVSKAF